MICLLIEYCEYRACTERENAQFEDHQRIEPECYADFLAAYQDDPMPEGYWRDE